MATPRPRGILRAISSTAGDTSTARAVAMSSHAMTRSALASTLRPTNVATMTATAARTDRPVTRNRAGVAATTGGSGMRRYSTGVPDTGGARDVRAVDLDWRTL